MRPPLGGGLILLVATFWWTIFSDQPPKKSNISPSHQSKEKDCGGKRTQFKYKSYHPVSDVGSPYL